MLSKTTRLRIAIRAEDRHGLYATTGAASVTASSNPMLDVARSLLANGAEPSSTLEGRYEGSFIGPATLASITKVRQFPKINQGREPMAA